MADALEQISKFKESPENYSITKGDKVIEKMIPKIILPLIEDYKSKWTPSLREINDKQAQEEIIEYLSTRDLAYESDIADDLRIPYDQVVKIMANLKDEGRIGVVSEGE